jgi:CHASE2 domain-containing sensor protein
MIERHKRRSIPEGPERSRPKASWPGKRDLMWALSIWLALALLEHALRDTILTDWLTRQAYTFLHANVALDRQPNFPVVIVDISHWRDTNAIKAIPDVPGLFVRSEVDFTDRNALQILLNRLAPMKPAAIGVDIDLSPLTGLEGSDGKPPPHNYSGPPGYFAFDSIAARRLAWLNRASRTGRRD